MLTMRFVPDGSYLNAGLARLDHRRQLGLALFAEPVSNAE
jgi:hypothetical protein